MLNNLTSGLNAVLAPTPTPAHLVSKTVKVNGREVSLTMLPHTIVIGKTANKIPYAILLVDDGDKAKQEFETSDQTIYSPGNEIEIQAGYHQKNETIFKGIIVRHGLKILPGQHPFLEIECKDMAVKLTAGRKNHYFYEQKDSEIIEEIFRKNKVNAAADNTKAKHREMIQYFATDWDFAVTRAEANGMLVLPANGNWKIKKPDFGQKPKFTLNFGTSIRELEAEMDARDQFPAAKTAIWKPADQEVSTMEASPSGVSGGGFGGGLAKAAGAAGGLARVAGGALGVDLPGTPPDTDFSKVMGWENFLLQHGGNLSPEELQNWAEAQFTKSQLAKLRGRVKFDGVADIQPGDCIHLKGIGLRHEGKVFVTAVSHEIGQGDWATTAQFGLSKNWFAHDYPDATEAPATALLPAVHGLQIGIVTALAKDPDGEDRIQVRLPLVDAKGEGAWMRMACQDAGNKRGSFFRPEIGDEVVVGFLNDDPRQGIVLGMLNSSAKPAPFSPTDDKNHEKGWVTRSGMKMVFNDEKKSLVIETPKGKKFTLDEDAGKITLEDENKNTITLDKDGILIESSKNLTLKAKQDVKIEGLNITNAAQSNFKAEGKAQSQLTASGDVVVKGAFVRIN